MRPRSITEMWAITEMTDRRHVQTLHQVPASMRPRSITEMHGTKDAHVISVPSASMRLRSLDLEIRYLTACQFWLTSDSFNEAVIARPRRFVPLSTSYVPHSCSLQ